MSDEKPQNLEFKIHCMDWGCLATLSFPDSRGPKPTDFSCQTGLSYPAGVVCNFGGVPCSGYDQALQLFYESKKLKEHPGVITEKLPTLDQPRLPEPQPLSAQNPAFSTETYKGFTIYFQNPTEKRAYMEMIDRRFSFLEKIQLKTIPKAIVPTPSDEEGLAHQNAQRSAM